MNSIMHEDEDEVELQLEPGVICVRLTDIVREQYKKHLKNQLEENFKKCNKTAGQQVHVNTEHLENCVALMEEKAIQACMVARLYQSKMTKMIAKVRRNTQEGRMELQLQKQLVNEQPKLADEIPKICLNKATQTRSEISKISIDRATQTNNLLKPKPSKDEGSKANKNDSTRSLTQRIDEFRDFLKMQEVDVTPSPSLRVPPQRRPLRKSMNSSVRSLSTSSTDIENAANIPSKVNRGDPAKKAAESSASAMVRRNESDQFELDLEKELEDMFREDEGNLEKELAHMFRERDEYVVSTTDHTTPSSLAEKTPSVVNASQQQSLESAATSLTASANYPLPLKDLRMSVWPAKLFYHREKLAKYLNLLLEDDLRWQDVMETKFVSLFGEDSDDEFTVWSPSIEFDNVVKCSSKSRIMPWIKKHLLLFVKTPLSPGELKSLVQELARHIILLKQYPDEIYVQKIVKAYLRNKMLS